MKSTEYYNHPNSKIRSFLSPYNKHSNRSYSATQFHHYETRKNYQAEKMAFNSQKIYNEKGRGKNKLQINMVEYAKCDKKESRLVKYRMKEKQNLREQKMDDNSDLITKIRELKQKVVKLEVEKKMLEQNQEQDMKTIMKQNEIIKNLQQAISLNRIHSNYSEKMHWQNQREVGFLISEKEMRRSQKHDSRRIKQLLSEIQKIKRENNCLIEKNSYLQQQNKRIQGLLTKQTDSKPEAKQYLQYQKIQQQERSLRQLRQIESKLCEASDRRRRQLQQIDTLLFSQNF